jgi:hypothetical protein
MNLYHLLVLLEPVMAPTTRQGETARMCKEIMQRYNLGKEDLPRLRQALAAGNFRLTRGAQL